jgi:hypothetical protein
MHMGQHGQHKTISVRKFITMLVVYTYNVHGSRPELKILDRPVIPSAMDG